MKKRIIALFAIVTAYHCYLALAIHFEMFGLELSKSKYADYDMGAPIFGLFFVIAAMIFWYNLKNREKGFKKILLHDLILFLGCIVGIVAFCCVGALFDIPLDISDTEKYEIFLVWWILCYLWFMLAFVVVAVIASEICYHIKKSKRMKQKN